MQVSTTGDEMERRDLLALLYRAAATAPVWAALPPGFHSAHTTGRTLADPCVLGLLGQHPYRRLWATTPTPALMAPAVAHLNLVSQLLESSRPGPGQAKLAAAVSEAAEFVGWLAYDMGNLAGGYEHYQSAVAYAGRSGNDQLHAYLIAGMSLWAGLHGDGGRAVKLIEEAMRLVPSRGAPAAQAWLAAREAVAWSRVGDVAAAMEALGRCERAAERARPGEEPWPWAFPFDDARIAMYRGTVGTILAQPKIALPALQRGMKDLGPWGGASGGPVKGGSAEAGPKLRALVLCDLAETYLFSEEVEQTCLLLSEAFATGLRMGCDRVLKRVAEIRARLDPCRHVPAVRNLEDEMMTSVLDILGSPTPTSHPKPRL
jgi:hypothetical protein